MVTENRPQRKEKVIQEKVIHEEGVCRTEAPPSLT